MFLLLLAALAVPTAPPPAELLASGIQRFHAFDDEGAAPILKRALAANPPGEIAAKAHLYLGLIALNAVKPDLARTEFRKALEANPLIELPAQVSPKVELLFGEVRRAMIQSNEEWQTQQEAAAPIPPAHGPTLTPAAPGAALVPPSEVAPGLTAEAPKSSRTGRRILSLALGGVGLGCEAVAIYGGTQIASYNSFVNQATSTHPSEARAASALSTAQFWSVAWIVFAAAGPVALGGGVLAW